MRAAFYSVAIFVLSACLILDQAKLFSTIALSEEIVLYMLVAIMFITILLQYEAMFMIKNKRSLVALQATFTKDISETKELLLKREKDLLYNNQRLKEAEKNLLEKQKNGKFRALPSSALK